MSAVATLEITQGQMDGFFRQLPFKWYLSEAASVGDSLQICPWVASRAVGDFSLCLVSSGLRINFF
jgi:hypothetical protein